MTPSSVTPSSPAPSSRTPSSATRDRAVVVALLAALAVLFLVTSWSLITGPFGDSDEGINGAVWGANSQGLRELGPIESRLGGVRVDHTKYATHPPLIVVETAVIERIVGQHPWSTRAAAWLGTLAALPLLFLLVRRLGLAPVAAAATVVATMASHMAFVYGVMLDTMIIAFPFGVATALVWFRSWQQEPDAARPNRWLVFALALVTCLGGWQATFLVGLCAVSTAARARRRPGALLEALPYAAAVVIGVGLTLGWAYWVYGSFEVLNDKLVRRTGGTEPVSLADMVGFQAPWLTQLLGLGFLGWVACAVSLRDRRFRPLAALSLASVILYALFLKEGSGGHQYWNYWGLLPAAVGIAYVFGALARALDGGRRVPTTRTVAVLVVAAVVVAAVNLRQPNQAQDLIEDGYAPVSLVDGTPLPAGQVDLPYVAEPFRIDDWLRYRGGPAGRTLQTADDLRTLARDHPDHLVLVLGSCASPDPTGICDRLTFGPPGAARPDHVAPRFETAAALAARLP